ncbi:MAG: YbjN domain-containing protein [Deltaproteobacteria bacterium]|nr:YbjN domain-containing protein [Deltaproteobacteria bacterium]
MDISQIYKLMYDDEYTVRLVEGGFILWRMNDNDRAILTSSDSTSLTFMAGAYNTNLTLKDVNEWAHKHKYSNISIDEERVVILELNLDLTGGVTQSRIDSFLATCIEDHDEFRIKLGEVSK